MCGNEPLDMMLVIDGSGTIQGTEFQRIKDWIKALTRIFDLQGSANIGVLQYSFANAE